MSALVAHGEYRTLPGLGTIGGPYVATIWGFEAGPMQGRDDNASRLPNPCFPGSR